MSPLWWPFFPFLTIAKSAKAFVVVLAMMIKDWRALWQGITPGLLGKALLLFLFVVIGFFAPRLTLVPMVLAALAFLSYGLYLLVLRCKDVVRWRKWNKNTPGTMSTDEFIESVRSFKTETYRVRFINTVRTKSLIIDSESTEQAMYNFVKKLEMPPIRKPYGGSRFIRFADVMIVEVKKFFNIRARSQNNDYVYGVAVLDETLRLLEQVRATR